MNLNEGKGCQKNKLALAFALARNFMFSSETFLPLYSMYKELYVFGQGQAQGHGQGFGFNNLSTLT
jgi:hypothetical protein